MFLCFPISFLSAIPPPPPHPPIPPEQAQFLLISLTASFAENISSSHVYIFVLLSSFTPNLPLQPQLAFCPALPPPSPMSSAQPPAPSAAAGQSGARKCPPLPWVEEAGIGGLVGPGWVCSGYSCMPACGCRETQHHESVLPLHLEDFFG